MLREPRKAWLSPVALAATRTQGPREARSGRVDAALAAAEQILASGGEDPTLAIGLAVAAAAVAATYPAPEPNPETAGGNAPA